MNDEQTIVATAMISNAGYERLVDDAVAHGYTAEEWLARQVEAEAWRRMNAGPKTPDEIHRGEKHTIAEAPVKFCWCATCKLGN